MGLNAGDTAVALPSESQVFTSGGTWNKPTGPVSAGVRVSAERRRGGSRSHRAGAPARWRGGYSEMLINPAPLTAPSPSRGAAGAAGSSASGNGHRRTSSFGSFCSATGGVGGSGIASTTTHRGDRGRRGRRSGESTSPGYRSHRTKSPQGRIPHQLRRGTTLAGPSAPHPPKAPSPEPLSGRGAGAIVTAPHKPRSRSRSE